LEFRNLPIDNDWHPWDFCNVANTIEILRAEAARYQSLAKRLSDFADELERELPSGASAGASPTTGGGEKRDATNSATQNGRGEFAGLTQPSAILKALESGPQTTTELFERLNAGGQSFKKVVYVSSIIPRIKEKIERLPDGRLKLKDETHAP